MQQNMLTQVRNQSFNDEFRLVRKRNLHHNTHGGIWRTEHNHMTLGLGRYGATALLV